MIYSFFGGEISDTGYVEGNMEYSEEYRDLLNYNITKKLNGYIPLSRLIYFYLEDDTLSLKSIYENNLDYELKTINQFQMFVWNHIIVFLFAKKQKYLVVIKVMNIHINLLILL